MEQPNSMRNAQQQQQPPHQPKHIQTYPAADEIDEVRVEGRIQTVRSALPCYVRACAQAQEKGMQQATAAAAAETAAHRSSHSEAGGAARQRQAPNLAISLGSRHHDACVGAAGEEGRARGAASNGTLLPLLAVTIYRLYDYY